ncbi:hypothetical protein GCM10022280_25260 [Sphingomonas swuensis]|uniref:tRNA(Ile)-lysidine synthase n=1 Tax=Sphingomonas swuensis TaxID=977800 RepID=A0ABP7TCF3_9SPHN
MSRRPPEVTAFAARLGQTLDRLVPEGELGVAVSGGPDSLALLLLAAEARPGQVKAATVDHGLRPESAAEAAFVADCCTRLGIPHDVLTVTVASGASLQAQARTARYAALAAWAERFGLAAVATAHHADDQAETLLMRLARGSGLAGLAGVRESRALTDRVRLVRPLLGLRKAALAAVVEAAGLEPVDDPANADPRHDRSRVRSLLGRTEWLDSARLARSATALAEAEEALAHAANRLANERLVRSEHGVRIEPHDLPAEFRRRLLLLGYDRLGLARPDGPEIERAMRQLEAGTRVTLGGALLEGGTVWRLSPEPPRRS